MKLAVSASPHIHSGATTRRIMLDVVIALVPTLAAAVYIFGFRAFLLTAVTVAAAVLSEHVSRRLMKRGSTIGDLSAVVTGLILATKRRCFTAGGAMPSAAAISVIVKPSISLV